jgi:guanyl-specific ribonuclease Sa
MMKKISTALTLIIIIIILAVTLKNNKDMNDIKNIISPNAVTQEKVGKSTTSNKTTKKTANSEISTPNNSSSIKELTKVDVVSKYILEKGELPEYYITKREAMELGWVASKGNLCEVAPGKAIGGDNFTNREKTLPTAQNRKWYEVDVNYNCGNRGADRIVFSSDGLVFVTYDHYKTFKEIKQ